MLIAKRVNTQKYLTVKTKFSFSFVLQKRNIIWNERAYNSNINANNKIVVVVVK